MDIKITISNIAKQSPPSTQDKACKSPSLQDKIDYALGLLEAGAPNRRQAVDFLQKVYHSIQKQHPYKQHHSDMMDKLQAVFSTYGIKYKNSQD
jgi:hypothetical protein